MQILTTAVAPTLAALLQADPEYARRYSQCLRDIEEATTTSELKAIASDGNCKQTYIKEWNSFHGMLQRARKYKIPLSPELRDFPTFLAHVGPKPHYDAVGKLSLDKSNKNGYILGHIRWETPEGQTRNRRTSKFHLYKGRYYTDIELAAVLGEIVNRHVKADTVKKRRLRGKSTADQFAIEGVVYESGFDPVTNWDFPAQKADKLHTLYRCYHRRGESRLEFFVRWLRTHEIPRLEEADRCKSLTGEQRHNIGGAIMTAQSALAAANEWLEKLKQDRIEQVIKDSIYHGEDSIHYEEKSIKRP